MRFKIIPFLIFIFFVNGKFIYSQENAPEISHYIFSSFIEGTVKFKNCNVQTAMLNYNTLTEEMIFKSDGVNLALTELESIDTVTIDNRKFIPHEKIFFEEISAGIISFYIQHRSQLQLKGDQVGYGGTSMISSTTKIGSLSNSGLVYNLELPGDYNIEDDTHFWIKYHDKFFIVDNQKDIIKKIPEKAKEIKNFVKELLLYGTIAA